MVTVHNRVRDVRVQYPGQNRDAKSAHKETCDHGQGGVFWCEPAIDQVLLRRWKHAVQGGEDLSPGLASYHLVDIFHTHHDTKRQTQPRGKKGITVLDLEALFTRELADNQIDTYYRCCVALVCQMD